MPSYGPAKNAYLHPKEPIVAAFDREIALIHKRRAALLANCDHHFIPEGKPLEVMPKSLVEGVYDAGLSDSTSVVAFFMQCTKCDRTEKVSISERCPCCLAPLTATHLDETTDPPEKYFNNSPGMLYSVISFTCSCGFKAAGLLWDR